MERGRRKRSSSIAGLCFVLPFLLGFIAFYLLPFGVSVLYTLFSPSGEFLGLSGYYELTQNTAFRLAFQNTFRFILTGVPLITVISLLLALLINRITKASIFFRSVFLFPMLVPAASIIMVVNLLFEHKGIINTILENQGISTVDWINSDYAFWVLLALYIWKNFGYNVILFMAGLSMIPPNLYESAKVEGASSYRCFFRITMPMLVPTLFFVIVISIVNSFKSFREAYILGGNIPHSSIYMLQHFLNNNFQNINYVRLSIAAFAVFAIIFVVVFILYIFWRKRAKDNEE